MHRSANELICPLCNAPNHCQAHQDETCWCTQVTMPEALLDLVPQDKKRKACICQTCLQAFTADPQVFTLKLQG